MMRLEQVLEEAKARYPHDAYLARWDEYLRSAPRNVPLEIQAYNRALASLDSDSWSSLKSKALSHFNQKEKDPRRGKQAFYNQLNEAFAYEFLVGKGAKNIRFIAEEKGKTPDIEYELDGKGFCEVKTISRSKDDYDRFDHGLSWDGSVYASASEELLAQVKDCIRRGKDQIRARGGGGIVFILIKFDDFTHSHIDRYRVQLETLLVDHPEAYVKIGLQYQDILPRQLPDHRTGESEIDA